MQTINYKLCKPSMQTIFYMLLNTAVDNIIQTLCITNLTFEHNHNSIHSAPQPQIHRQLLKTPQHSNHNKNGHNLPHSCSWMSSPDKIDCIDKLH